MKKIFTIERTSGNVIVPRRRSECPCGRSAARHVSAFQVGDDCTACLIERVRALSGTVI